MIAAIFAAGAGVVSLAEIYDWLGRASQFLIQNGTFLDAASKTIKPNAWFEAALAILVLFFLGFWGLAWKLLRQQPNGDEYGSLTVEHAKLNTSYAKAQEMIGGMMTATSRIRNQLSPAGKIVKSFKSVRITYYIHADFTAHVIRESAIYANSEPIHFWTAGYHPTAHADKVDYLKDIKFEVTDENGHKLPYLPIRNDPLAKDVVIYFLPRIEPASMRHVRISFTWPRYLNQLAKLGYENFAVTLDSIDAIPSVEFFWFLEPGTGKNLVGDVISGRVAGDVMDPAATTFYQGVGWRGFSYKVSNGPSGSVKYEIIARLEAP